jgi:hypothetical protein
MDKPNEHSKNLKIYSIIKRIKLEKLFTLGIILILLTSTFLIFIPKIEAQNRFSGKGSGTQKDPYVIANVKQLQEMKYDLKAHYVLGNDIDASETKYWNNGQGFEPIGDKDNPFTGSFDGRGYKIYNLYINTTRDYVGLFGYVANAPYAIKNVGLENVKISSTGNFVGGLIGVNNGNVNYTYTTGSVNGKKVVGGLIGVNWYWVNNTYSAASVNGNVTVGGLIGTNYDSVYYSYSTGSVTGNYYVGGLIGYGDYRDRDKKIPSFVNNCYSTASVNGNYAVGGLIGYGWGVAIKYSYSTGSINGKENVGGLIGEIWGYLVEESYSNASVYGEQNVGGFVGFADVSIRNCYSTGSVTGTGDHVGGFIGFNQATIHYCYSTGSVSGKSYYVGGFDGGYNTIGWAKSSFWDIQTSGLTRSGSGTGKTTEEMKNVRTYTDKAWSKGLDSPWDFVGNPYDDKGNEDIWDINPNINNGYPYLKHIRPIPPLVLTPSPIPTTTVTTSPTTSPITTTQMPTITTSLVTSPIITEECPPTTTLTNTTSPITSPTTPKPCPTTTTTLITTTQTPSTSPSAAIPINIELIIIIIVIIVILGSLVLAIRKIKTK